MSTFEVCLLVFVVSLECLFFYYAPIIALNMLAGVKVKRNNNNIKTGVNLCDICKHNASPCRARNLFVGKGYGLRDNKTYSGCVLLCDAFEPKES